MNMDKKTSQHPQASIIDEYDDYLASFGLGETPKNLGVPVRRGKTDQDLLEKDEVLILSD